MPLPAHGNAEGHYWSLLLLLRQSIVCCGVGLPMCKTCVCVHQISVWTGTRAWLLSLLSADASKCCENAPCSEGKARSTVGLTEEMVNALYWHRYET